MRENAPSTTAVQRRTKSLLERAAADKYKTLVLILYSGVFFIVPLPTELPGTAANLFTIEGDN